MSLFDDIEYCKKLLYDYVYDNDIRDDYEFEPIILDDIQIDDIKKPKDFRYNDILKNHFEFLHSYSNKYYFKNIDDEKSKTYQIIIGKYDNDSTVSINELHRSEIINMIAPYTLSEITLQNVLLPLMNFDISYNSLVKINNDIVKNLNEDFKNSVLCVNVCEYFYEMTTLHDYIEKNYEHMSLELWIYIYFQLLYTYHDISKKYPEFRHNNLTTFNILIGNDTADMKKRNYIVDGKQYNLPKLSQKIKLTGFDKCVLSRSFRNMDIKKSNQIILFDIIKLTYEIYDILGKFNYNNIDVLNFLNSIVSKEDKGITENEYIQKTSIIPSPTYILTKNNFFSDFIINSMENDSEQIVMPDSDDIETPTESDQEYHNIAKKKDKKDRKGKKNKKRNDEDIDEDELDQIEVDEDVEVEDDEKEPEEYSETSAEEDEENDDIDNDIDDDVKLDSISSGGGLDSIKKSISDSFENVADMPKKTVNAIDALFNSTGAKPMNVSQIMQLPQGVDPDKLSQKLNGTMSQQMPEQSMQNLGSAVGVPPMGAPQQMLDPALMGMPQQMMDPSLMGMQPQMGQMPPQMMPPQMPPQMGLGINNLTMMGQVPLMNPSQQMMGMPPQMPQMPMMGGGKRKGKHYKIVNGEKDKKFFF